MAEVFVDEISIHARIFAFLHFFIFLLNININHHIPYQSCHCQWTTNLFLEDEVDDYDYDVAMAMTGWLLMSCNGMIVVMIMMSIIYGIDINSKRNGRFTFLMRTIEAIAPAIFTLYYYMTCKSIDEIVISSN
jgi:hypothetical protein